MANLIEKKAQPGRASNWPMQRLARFAAHR